ncbi:MAG TPA: response regulator [Opitutaceae bacterium]
MVEATTTALSAPASVIDVLIVDDEPVIRDSLGLALGHAGLRVRTAATVSEAFALLEAHPVRLLVTDICMPEVSGLDLIVAMSTTWPDTPVLTISGGGALGGAEQIFEVAQPLGSCRMLAKPFSLRAFMDLVGELLSKSPVPQQA